MLEPHCKAKQVQLVLGSPGIAGRSLHEGSGEGRDVFSRS